MVKARGKDTTGGRREARHPIASARHVMAAAQPSQIPHLELPHVAFAGRSNVGKSSLLNALTGRRGLARVSSTPGRTRCLHFFLLNECFAFVDLPGYGYAAVGREERASWKFLVDAYLTRADRPAGVVMLLDLRRDPDEPERAFVDWLVAHRIPVQVVATKADKLPKSARHARQKALEVALPRAARRVISVATPTRDGIDDLWRIIASWLPPDARASLS